MLLSLLFGAMFPCLKRHPGDAARLSSEDVERMYHMYTRRDGLASVAEAADRQQFVPRDQDEVRMMFLSMRATRDAARRGEHIAGWRLDAGRGAILREYIAPFRHCSLLSCSTFGLSSVSCAGEAAWREGGRRDAAMGGEPGREAQLQEGAARENANKPMERARREGTFHGTSTFQYPEYRRPMHEGGGGGPARGRGSSGSARGAGGGGSSCGDGGDDEAYPDRNSDPVPPRGVATGDRGVRSFCMQVLQILGCSEVFLG